MILSQIVIVNMNEILISDPSEILKNSFQSFAFQSITEKLILLKLV